METLFPLPDPSVYPEGFTYIENFISSEEEHDLLQDIELLPLHPFDFHGFQAKREVISFGYDYSFDKKTLSKGVDIPATFAPLITKVAAHLKINPSEFSELLVTRYPVGSVINWHRDAFPFDIVVGISLLSDCTFKLRPHNRQQHQRQHTIQVPVRKRSLYIMEGEARYQWQHSTAPVKAVRYSLTLRTLRRNIQP